MTREARRFTIGKCYVTKAAGRVVAGGGSRRSGTLVVFIDQAGKIAARAKPKLWADFLRARKGGANHHAVDDSGEPSGEMMMLKALRSGCILEAATAVALLRKDGATELLSEITWGEFERLAGDWLAAVVADDGAEGLRALASWCEAADRVTEAEASRETTDRKLWDFLRAAEDAAVAARGVPSRKAVFECWKVRESRRALGERPSATRIRLAEAGELEGNESGFKDIQSRAGFSWLPSSRCRSLEQGMISES